MSSQSAIDLQRRGHHAVGRSRPALCARLALLLGACAARPPLPEQAPASARGASVVTFHGHIKLDPRAGYEHSEGDVWQHLFYLDGALFDAMLCYAHVDRCEVVDLQRGNTASAWSASLTELPADVTPFVLQYDVQPDGEWRDASRVAVRVLALGIGEVGATQLERDHAAQPPSDLRERLRAQHGLQRIYESLARNFQERPLEARHFPDSRPELPSPPPCGPTWVRDARAVEWLGLSAPVVLSWAFSVEAEPGRGELRVIARRDRTCRGDFETLVLRAHVDGYGDLERTELSAAPAEPPMHSASP